MRELRKARPHTWSDEFSQLVGKNILCGCWLMLWCLVACDVSAQEAAPEFVAKLNAVAPFRALVSAAESNHISLAGIAPMVKTNLISPGDSFTAVVTLVSKPKRMQWLLRLQAAEPTPSERADNPQRTMVIYNTLGNKLEFVSTPAFVTLRTLGPFLEDGKGKKTGDNITRFVVDQGFLGLALEQAATALFRMRESHTNGPFASGTEPFGDALIAQCRKANETWKVSAQEERALAGSFPALLSYFKTVQENQELVRILKQTLVLPSLWSLLWHGGISSTEFRWDAKHLMPADAAAWGVSAQPPAYYCPMTLLLNQRRSLELTLVVTAPDPPLLACGGVLGLLAENPQDKQVYLSLRIVSASRCEPGGRPKP
jgi:hypothetical protein